MSTPIDLLSAIKLLVESSKQDDMKGKHLQLQDNSNKPIFQFGKETGEQTQSFTEKGPIKRKQCGQYLIILLENGDECPQEFVNNFAKQFSIPTHKYENLPNANRFRRYQTWLNNRNRLIYGFTVYKDNYYMITDKNFDLCIDLYGWCSKCKILRCSPVWCICGHKEWSNGWTSENESIDKFIKETQIQTKSANEAYLEWIPFTRLDDSSSSLPFLSGLPSSSRSSVELIPLNTPDKSDDLYYHQVSRVCRTSLIITRI